MHRNRLSSLDWNPQPASLAPVSANPMMAFAVCPIGWQVPAWQQQLYQAALEQAQVSVQPSAWDHAMAVSPN